MPRENGQPLPKCVITIEIDNASRQNGFKVTGPQDHALMVNALEVLKQVIIAQQLSAMQAQPGIVQARGSLVT